MKGLQLRLAVEAFRLLMGKLSAQPESDAVVHVHWCHRLVWSGLLKKDYTCDSVAQILQAMKHVYGPCKIQCASGSQVLSPVALVSARKNIELVVLR